MHVANKLFSYYKPAPLLSMTYIEYSYNNDTQSDRRAIKYLRRFYSADNIAVIISRDNV